MLSLIVGYNLLTCNISESSVSEKWLITFYVWSKKIGKLPGIIRININKKNSNKFIPRFGSQDVRWQNELNTLLREHGSSWPQTFCTALRVMYTVWENEITLKVSRERNTSNLIKSVFAVSSHKTHILPRLFTRKATSPLYFFLFQVPHSQYAYHIKDLVF